MEYMSTREASEKWEISVRRVYAIPINAEKPKDGRIRSDKFIKKQEV